ncbi:hypothetical protein EYF80_044164 [Liparis tanakae]|uniref:Uncharacterized protein n=1 Tax=Liparis tanakae TaxID=230148 RepID=A0A4Z2FWP0_9TELE|nr:hypothetical protein EYF80_044164 [Liparis tanakae]
MPTSSPWLLIGAAFVQPDGNRLPHELITHISTTVQPGSGFLCWSNFNMSTTVTTDSLPGLLHSISTNIRGRPVGSSRANGTGSSAR